ncbi:MAG: PAS domain-containing protein, partial [Pseudomonadota bacterium]
MSDTPFTFNGRVPGQSDTQSTVQRIAPRDGADSRTLLVYWNSVRQNFDVPHRCDIDPRGITGMLSRTFILERVAPGLARFRVAGTHLNDLLGMDVRGMPISAMFQPKGREELAESLEQVFEKPGILRAALVSPQGFRLPQINAELLVLPLRDTDGDVTRAIGCLLAKGQIGKAPRRFEFRHLRVDPVTVVKAP